MQSNIEHICNKPYDDISFKECSKNEEYLGSCGEAIYSIFYSEHLKRWFSTNGEYYSIIKYCPWCGLELIKKKNET